MPNRLDLTGVRFARLLALSPAGKNKHGHRLWHCKCDCGKSTTVLLGALRGGRTKSCGCLRRINAHSSTHRMSKSREYRAYRDMINRCYNKSRESFQHYGARGITVCDNWRFGDGEKSGFECFMEDIGPKPSPIHTIERNDPNGNYEPVNISWATALEQANNRRNTRRITYRGHERALADAVRLAGNIVHIECAWIRIKTGWPTDKALETPRLFESRAAEAARRRHEVPESPLSQAEPMGTG